MTSYVATLNFINTYPYSSGVYSFESKTSRVYPIGDLERITEASVTRVTEDGVTRITE